MKLTIPGTIRIKKNSKRIFARGRFKTVLPSEAYLKWEKDARAHAMIQKTCKTPIKLPVAVKAAIYYKGPMMDIHGAFESIADAFQGILWENDSQIKSWDGSRIYHDKDNPRTEIEVTLFEG